MVVRGLNPQSGDVPLLLAEFNTQTRPYCAMVFEPDRDKARSYTGSIQVTEIHMSDAGKNVAQLLPEATALEIARKNHFRLPLIDMNLAEEKSLLDASEIGATRQVGVVAGKAVEVLVRDGAQAMPNFGWNGPPGC